jgi:hypothetical protein
MQAGVFHRETEINPSVISLPLPHGVLLRNVQRNVVPFAVNKASSWLFGDPSDVGAHADQNLIRVIPA